MNEGAVVRNTIRTAYQINYADGSKTDWMPIPDPEHPSYQVGWDWDESDDPPFVRYTDQWKKDEEIARAEGIDDDIGWIGSYLTGYTVMMPVEHNERRVSGQTYECDFNPDWTARYTYHDEHGAYHLEGLRRNDKPNKKVIGTTVCC